MSPYYQFDLDSTAYAVACPTCRADADCPCSERTYRSGFPEPYSVEPHPERVAAGKRWAAEQREHIAQSNRLPLPRWRCAAPPGAASAAVRGG